MVFMTSEAYVKGSRTKIVSTPSERVAAEFAGFRPASELSVDSVDRGQLQATAKSLGIKANQSNEALVKAIAEFEPADETVVDPADKSETLGQAPETDNGGSPIPPSPEQG
jgi:hypothetical protein